MLAVSHAKGSSPSAPGSLTVSVRLRLAERIVRGSGSAEGPPPPPLAAADRRVTRSVIPSTARAPNERIAAPTELAAAVALMLLPTPPSVPSTSPSRPCSPPTRLLSAEVAATAVLSSTVSAAARSTSTSLAPVATSATTMAFSASSAVPLPPSEAGKEEASDATVLSTAVTNAGDSDGMSSVASSCGL